MDDSLSSLLILLPWLLPAGVLIFLLLRWRRASQSDPDAKVKFGSGLTFRFVAVLVGVAVAILLLAHFSSETGSGGRPASANSDLPGIVLAVIPWILILGFILFLVRRIRSVRFTFNKYFDTVALAESGQIDEAAKNLDEFIAAKQLGAEWHAVFLLYRGLIHLYKKEYERAQKLLKVALETPNLQHNNPLLTRLNSALALSQALSGDLAAAEETLEKIAAIASPHQQGLLLLPQTVVLLRRGKPQNAAEMLTAKWHLAEAVVMSHPVKCLRLMHAFTLRHEPQTSGNDAEINRLIGCVQPCRPGEFDYLGAHWPEFRAFLADRGLAPRIESIESARIESAAPPLSSGQSA